MDIQDILASARQARRRLLTEAEAKALLSRYDVPVVSEIVAGNEAEAVDAAGRTGYPVVLKGLGARLAHKTERGLVRLGLKTPEDVVLAARAVSEAAGSDLEGFLLQPFLAGKREFVAGLFRDPQFGAVVMFGLGGIFTEALGDAAFRLAPIGEREAGDMLDSLAGVRLLGPFRGEQAADRDALIRTLMGLSRLAADCPEIAEVDVNPLLVGPDGRVTAVDALVVLGHGASPRAARPPVPPLAIRRLFYPRSVAFVGASGGFRKWGHMLYTNLVAGGYRGRAYLVNPRGGTIAGQPVYRSLSEIPDPVDLAVVTIPADKVPFLIPEMQAKSVPNMLLITSGFSETGPEGRRREERLVQAAREAGILILGPNTMGICNPHAAFFCCHSHVRPRPGTTALVAQSGNLGVQLLAFAEQEGIGIRAFGGSGNEAMITIEDFLEGFEVDDLTGMVVLYIESVKDGRRFFEAARRVGLRKPVVVLKGGRTEAGNKAAASHTGALASDRRVFEAACQQAGVVLVETSMDLLDLSAAFSSLPLPRGNRVAVMSLGGGWAVVTSDLCMENGLVLPPLAPEIVDRIDRILPPYWNRSNPVDLVGEFDLFIPLAIAEELLRWDGCDALIHLGILGRGSSVAKVIDSILVADPDMDRAFLADLPGITASFEADYQERMARLMEQYGKPVVGVYLLADETSRTVTDVAGSPYKGVAYLTPERAVRALAKMSAYVAWRSRQEGDRP